ncbi:DUF2268 domain-containing putative Zn-dependent protease [Fulvimarina sp. MAC8]|uniref:DUF2268 domain-containing putative Zn-dependent protease n=1 Tax=Fulvimarina sp. MAC8 TaxID=3162874 RepID=UPI0032EEC3AE
MSWTLHYANANNQFGNLIEPISRALERAERNVEAHMPAINLDVVVQAWPGQVIPELGHVGYAPTGTMMQLTFDPANNNLRSHLGEALERMIVHEFHHVMRWRGPGYGNTLGEALVSEGLASQFVKQLYDSPPEPWEAALTRSELANHVDFFDRHWDDKRYGHARCFFGAGDLPRWLGYSFGYELVSSALVDMQATPSALVHEPAASFRPSLQGMRR